MTEKIKVTLNISAEAFWALAQLTSERKRGDFVSGLIVAASEEEPGGMAPREIATQLRLLADSLAAM